MSTQGPTEAWTWRETPESNSAVMVTGNQIRAARMLAGLTQKALAAEAGIAMQTLNHMEAAGHAPARPQELTGTRAGCAKELKALCLCQREPC